MSVMLFDDGDKLPVRKDVQRVPASRNERLIHLQARSDEAELLEQHRLTQQSNGLIADLHVDQTCLFIEKGTAMTRQLDAVREHCQPEDGAPPPVLNVVRGRLQLRGSEDMFAVTQDFL